MARPGMDYQFFQMLSERIENASGGDQEQLLALREQLLELTREIDETVEQRIEIAHQNLDRLLEADDISAAVEANLAAIDEYFIQALTAALQSTRESENQERLAKLEAVLHALNKYAQAPPEYELINELLEVADDEEAIRKTFESQVDEVNAKVLEYLTGLMSQAQATVEQSQGENEKEQRELLERMNKVYKVALRMNMEKSFKN